MFIHKFKIIIFYLFSFVLSQELIINEFCASNTSTFPEMHDFDDFVDWIEVFNTTENNILLENYFLSDDFNEPLKWKFPNNTIINPQEHLLIWADDFNEGPGVEYVRPYWPWDNFITQHYHTNFKLNKEGEQICLSKAVPNETNILINEGAFWNFIDNGSDQGNEWTLLNFDDSSWNGGYAELGYGDDDEVTLVEYGPDEDNKYITTYFRHIFLIENPDNHQSIQIRLKRDDGAVLYLNENEIHRVNMPDGFISFDTYANNTVSGNEEDFFYTTTLNDIVLQDGENLLAVEIHQANGSSSDISFDLELTSITYSNIELLDSISFTQQMEDISFGKTSNLNNLMYFGEPTPGAPNNTNAINNLNNSDPISCSHESGFYSGLQYIEFFHNDGEDNIYYTTDGSKPRSQSFQYSGPIEIDVTTVIKSRRIENNKLPGKILTTSIFIDEPNHLPTISLSVDPLLLWDDNLGIYENEFKQREIPVAIDFFDQETNFGFSINAGARLGGLNIWTKPQKPFTIYTRNRYGDDFINYQIFDNKPIAQFSRVVFRNGGDDWEETLLRDSMTESIALNRMQCGYMAYKPSALFLNGEYWGIHNIREKFNKHFFYENFNADPNNIDHLEYGSTESGTQLLIVEGDLDNYNQLINFINENDLNLIENYNQLKQMMNIDSFIDFITMTIFTANTSWGHNREWWRPRIESGRWEWLLVDIDRGFNIYNSYSNQLDDLIDDYQLFSDLLMVNQFKNRFLQRASAHFNSTFSLQRITEIVDSLSSIIEPEIPRHIAKWGNEGSISSMNNWNAELNEILEFTENRKSIVQNQFIDELNLEGLINIQFSIIPPEAGKFVINDVQFLNSNQSGSFIKNIPLKINVIPNPGYHFFSWTEIEENQQFEFNCNSDTSFTAIFELSSDILLPEIIDSDLELNSGQNYLVNQNLTIEQDVSMTIPEDVKIKFSENGNFIVRGILLVNGTENNPVQFIPNYQSNVYSWGAINFEQSSDTSIIKFSSIIGATKGIDPTIYKGAVSGINSSIILENIIIENVEFPVYIQGGSLEIKNSEITSEYICDYINVKNGQAIIKNNKFYGKSAVNTDAIDLDNVSDGIIENNWIYNFTGYNSDGIDIGELSNNILILNNFIYHSKDKGISIGQNSSVNIAENIIIGCNTGIAVKDNSIADIINNTFYFNDTTISCFEKNAGQGGGHVQITNSIFSKNLEKAIYTDEYSTYSINYSLSDDFFLDGIENLLMDPLFLDPSLYNLQLSTNSPCINNGDPSLGFDDDGSLSDIGAHYIYNEIDYPLEIPNELIGHLKINEILAKNESFNMDENDEYEDWIELYFNINSSMNLEGYSITDDENSPQKWIFPFIEIMGQGHLLLWADNEPEEGINHLNFKLSSEGEEIFLFDPNGYLLDSVIFPQQTDDISYGRINDGSGSWDFIDIPTPGLFNYNSDVINGDLNYDGLINVVDIISMVYLVLNNFFDVIADMNSDDVIDIIDIVQLVEIILGNSSYFDADIVRLEQTDNSLLVYGNGKIGAIELILSHNENFKLKLTDSALVSKYKQNNQLTSIIVVAPSAKTIFHTNDNYKIVDIVAANSENFIDVELPESFFMGDAYPNPFNSNTKFSFIIPSDMLVTLSIYNILGKEIEIISSQYFIKGRHTLNWNAEGYSSGIYFIKMSTDKFAASKKILLIK